MPRLSIQGHALDVSDDAALTWAVGTIVGTLEILGAVHWALTFAMPRRAATGFLKLLSGVDSSLRETANVADDGLLLPSINEALSPLESFVSAAQDLLEWEDAHISRKIRRAHSQVAKAQGPIHPPWAEEEGFRQRLGALSTAFSAYADALSRIIPRLRAMVPPSSPTESALTQLDKAERQLPDYKLILTLGYAEAIRRKAIGQSPSA